jgi:hypothetical protein
MLLDEVNLPLLLVGQGFYTLFDLCEASIGRLELLFAWFQSRYELYKLGLERL